MIALSALIYLPRRVLLCLSIATMAFHNLLDAVQASQFGAFAGVWNLLHQQGVFTIRGNAIVVGYPVLPWIAVMAAGFCCGPILLMDAGRRRRVLLIAGCAMTIGFVLLRAANVYGDPSPWSGQRTAILTLLSFLRTTKYPPSLQFLLMTLGPAFIALALVDQRHSWWTGALAAIGRVPLFFYVVHFWAIHVVASFMAWLRYGNASFVFLLHPLPSMGGPPALFPPGFGYPLWTTYLVWIAIVGSLYPLCVRFADFKTRHHEWWVSYL
jgi:uncharacterized membrane protein